MKEHLRADLKEEIESIKRDLEENGVSWSEDVHIFRQRVLESKIKKYDAFK